MGTRSAPLLPKPQQMASFRLSSQLRGTPSLGSPFSFFFLKRPLQLLVCSRALCCGQGERRRYRTAPGIHVSHLKGEVEGGTEVEGGVEVVVGSRSHLPVGFYC